MACTLFGWVVSPPPACVLSVTANGLSQRLRWEEAAKGWAHAPPDADCVGSLASGFPALPCARGHKSETFQHLCRAAE